MYIYHKKEKIVLMDIASFQNIQTYYKLKEFMNYVHTQLNNNRLVNDFLSSTEWNTFEYIDDKRKKRLYSSTYNDITSKFVITKKSDTAIDIYIKESEDNYYNIKYHYYHIGSVDRDLNILYN